MASSSEARSAACSTGANAAYRLLPEQGRAGGDRTDVGHTAGCDFSFIIDRLALAPAIFRNKQAPSGLVTRANNARDPGYRLAPLAALFSAPSPINAHIQVKITSTGFVCQ